MLGSRTPRVWTPPLRELKPDVLDDDGNIIEPATSLGFDVIEWARESLKVDLLPWQEWLLIHALELLPNGRLRFRTVLVLVARQNGKSLLSEVLALYSICVLGRRTVLTAAQDLDTAEDVWAHAVELATEEDPETGEFLRPDVAEMVRHVSRVNGKKALILHSGERYKVKAANRRAGRGLTGDLIVLDELREQQNWDAWGAITKTIQARPQAQVWALSNAGDVTSVVLRHLRLQAHKELGDPDGVVKAAEIAATAPTELDVDAINEALRRGEIDELNSWVDDDGAGEWDFSDEDVTLTDLQVDASTLGLFEWSATPGSNLYDVDEWARANPSMNYVRGETSLTARNLKSAADGDPEWVFRTENLCQWPDGVLAGMFPPGKWLERQTKPLVLPSGRERVREADRIVGKVWLGIDVSQDGAWTYIAAVGRRRDGQLVAEISALARGSDWVRDWIAERADRIHEYTGQVKNAPASEVLDALVERGRLKVRFTPWTTEDIFAAHRKMVSLVESGGFWHHPQGTLDQAAERATVRELPGGEVIDRMRSTVDVAPLIAMQAALWLATRDRRPPAPPPSAAVVRTTTPIPAALRIEPMGVI